jgi:sugar phosphate isomerase/epimerase
MPNIAHPISLAAGNVQEFTPPEMVSAAAAAGFDKTGLWVDPEVWTDQTTKDVRARLQDTGLTALDVEVIWLAAGEYSKAYDFVIDKGAEVGAEFALIVSGDPDITETKKKFAKLCERAAATNMTAVFEFLPITEVKSLSAAIDIVRDVDHPNAGVLIDTLHLARTGSTPDDLTGLDASLFPYIQIADAPLQSPGDTFEALYQEAIDGRLLPGEGELPIAETMAHMATGISISPEIRSAALRETYPDIVDRAKAIADSTRTFLKTM